MSNNISPFWRVMQIIAFIAAGLLVMHMWPYLIPSLVAFAFAVAVIVFAAIVLDR